MKLKSSCERRWISTGDPCENFRVFDKDEKRYRSDFKGLGNISELFCFNLMSVYRDSYLSKLDGRIFEG